MHGSYFWFFFLQRNSLKRFLFDLKWLTLCTSQTQSTGKLRNGTRAEKKTSVRGAAADPVCPATMHRGGVLLPNWLPALLETVVCNSLTNGVHSRNSWGLSWRADSLAKSTWCSYRGHKMATTICNGSLMSTSFSLLAPGTMQAKHCVVPPPHGTSLILIFETFLM